MLFALSGGARGQGIECGKARTAVERAICAAPGLVALDRQIAVAYADAVARQPGQAAGLKQQALAWIRARDAACALPAAQVQRCLMQQLTARLAALAPPPEPPLGPVVAAVPDAPRPLPGVPSAANPAAPASNVEPAMFRAQEQADASLRVTSPGRFALAVHSRTGVALQFVDMLTGPSDVVGEAGVRDGRVDLLLDSAVYRLRTFAGKGAAEEVTLTATPFRDAAPPRAVPPPGETFSADLGDLQQRAFWLLVPPSGQVRIEAAGRALADLRLWRAGRELSELEPAAAMIEAEPGHTMTGLRLVGRVEPGVYLAMAYGGPALTWTDGSGAMPFHLRSGVADALAEGWAAGRIGPFGSEVFAAPAFAGQFRLDLPQAAAATLRVDGQSTTMTRTSRSPFLVARGTAGRTSEVEVRGASGQPFTLRATEPAGGSSLSRRGTYWVSAVASGAGGDEVPPGVLLERLDGQDPGRIVASTVPVLSPGSPWRGRFNLRGPTSLLFRNALGGPVAVRTTGVAMQNDPGETERYDIPADYYVLRLAPEAGAFGAVDVTVGAPNAAPPLPLPLPADPSIPLGIQAVGPGQRLVLLAQSGPGLSTGLSARPVPVALAAGPLALTQAVGAPALVVPVEVAAGGTLSARELGGAAVPVLDEAGPQPGVRRVTVPPAERPRTVVLAWHRTPGPVLDIPAPPPEEGMAQLRPGAPVAFDLARNEQRGFALDVPEGGLYRVETTGRLRMAGRIGTAFIPRLEAGEANGVGQNMLLQHWLRAGHYRVNVEARASAGHAGIVADPAPLLAGAALLPGGSVRASLAAGTGVAFPLRIEQAGTYHLDLVGIGRAFFARLDDPDGWPLTRPADVTELEQALRPGEYRLLVSPDAVARQVIARLALVPDPAEISGHGPHALPFNEAQSATWREPPGRGDGRTPDGWTFSLAGAAELTLTLSDGMVAEIRAAGAGPDAKPVARVTGRWTGQMGAGKYRVDASSLGRNDRLEYTLTLASKELQPGPARVVALPARMAFALAKARVVSLTTWGGIPVKGVLRRADGTEVVRAGARANDWNIAVSRLLPAGAYTLELAAATPPEGGTDTRDQGVAAATENNGDDDQSAQSTPEPAKDETAQESEERGEQQVEVRLALPEALAPVAAPAEAAVLVGSGVHVLTVPQPAGHALLVAQAASEGSVVLALERQDAAGWRVVALEEGRTPLVAAPADGGAAAWRVEAWAVDGGSAPIRVAARAIEAEEQAGNVRLAAVAGFPAPVAAARVRLDGPGVLAVQGDGLLAAGWPGHAASVVEAGQVVAQSAALWLLGSAPGEVRVAALRIEPGVERTVAVPAGGAAVLPPPAAGRLQLWRAESGTGQPGLATDRGMGGVAAGSALVRAGGTTTLRNAGGDAAMRARVRLLDLALLAEQKGTVFTIPAGSAIPVRLPGNRELNGELSGELAGEVTVTLAAGTAALGGAVGDSVVWAPRAPLTRSFAAAGTVLLVNTGAAPAPVSLAWAAGEPGPALRAGMVEKRFFGAAGSFERAVEGGQLAVAGDATLLFQGVDGRVLRGRAMAAGGAGRVVVTHGAGPVVLSVAGPGVSPWTAAAAEAMTLPKRVVLGGPAMAFSLAVDGPSLLHATTTAPVLLGIGDAAPELFAAGAELHRAVAGGALVVHVISPHDGALAGTLALSAEAIRPAVEGLGESVAVAPGGSVAFGFGLARAATVGVGIRAEPDRAEVRLLDAEGAVLGEGVAQLRALPAGRYVIEARVPADAPATVVRPAIVGITPRGNGPPPDVARTYLELAGLKPQEPAQ